MRTASFMLLAAPLGYALLTGYLLLKIQPLPISLLPMPADDEDLVDAPLAA